MGVANLTEVFGPNDDVPDEHPANASPWFDDASKYQLYLTNIVATKPVPYKGAVGPFKVPYAVAASLIKLKSAAEYLSQDG